MASGVKFRAYPTKQQQILLERWLKAQTEVYNAKVAEAELHQLNGRIKAPSEEQKLAAGSAYEHLPLGSLFDEIPPDILWAGAKRWSNSYWRFVRGMGNKPLHKKRTYGKQTITVWRNEFRFYSLVETRQTRLEIWDRDVCIGDLKYKAHCEYKIPNSLTITRQAGRWYVSFSYGSWSCTDIEPETSPFDKQGEFLCAARTKTREEMENCSLAVVGCLPAIDSDGVVYDLEPGAKRRLEVKGKRRSRYLRKLKRMQPDSNRRKKLQSKVDRINLHRTNTLRNYVEKVSRKLADHPAEVIIFESVKSESMNWRHMPGHTRTQLRITSRTIQKAGHKKLIAVIPQKEGTLIRPTVPAYDPVKLKGRGLREIRLGSFKVWTPRKLRKKQEPPQPVEEEVRVGHAEFKCGDPVEVNILSMYGWALDTVIEFGEPDSQPLRVMENLIRSEREISDEIAQRVCLRIDDGTMRGDRKLKRFPMWIDRLRTNEVTESTLKKYGIWE